MYFLANMNLFKRSSVFVHGSTLTHGLISEKPTDRKWGLAVVTSIKVNVFECDELRGFLILFTGGLFQNVLYSAKFWQKCLNKCPKMQQYSDCSLSYHGIQNQET